MASKSRNPNFARPDRDNDPATPVPEREQGETANTSNAVKAKDAFGKPRNETQWTRESISAHNAKPSLETDGKTAKEQARKFRG
ncbi:MAG: hypothetical protein RIA08_08285 [Roseovarius sp.]|uniref:hypothetical protein n=1 Tax=Roseobacteraceae TaxID=2854170 RepID=UPI0032ED935E